MCLALVAKEVPYDFSIIDGVCLNLQKILQNTSMTFMLRLGEIFL